MDIQPYDQDQTSMMAQPRHPVMAAVPEVGAPRSNPLSMIWRRRNILAIVTFVCVAAAMVKYYISPAVYRSDARLFVQPPGGKASVEGSSASKLQTQCELIKSSALLTEIIGNPEIARLRTFESGRRGGILQENLQASVGKDNDIITVSFDSPYRKDAQQILQAVIAAYQNFHSTEKRTEVAKSEALRNKYHKELEDLQKKQLAFKKEHGVLSFTNDKGGNITLQNLQSLERALEDAHISTINLKSELDIARANLTDPLTLRQRIESLRAVGALSQPDLNESALRAQMLAMEQQMVELRRRYLPEHPAVRASQAAIADTAARISELERSLVQGHIMALEQKLAAARAREADFQQARDKQMKAALELNAKAADYEQIESEIKRLTKKVEAADMRIIELTAAENVGVPVIQVFDEPSEPATPIKPVRSQLLFSGLLIGLILGVFAALVRDWTDQGLHATDEIAQTLGVGLLGTVPHMPGPPNPLAHGRKVDLEPASIVAETYRTIRTAVFFGTPERESRTILVTSPTPGDGKSTFASNLAIAMAQTGKRVLLIDADFRRPVQHRVFECHPGAGLSTVLTGKDSLDQAIQHSGIASLDILPCGPVPTNPAEILNSQSFAEILEELSLRYEHVVLDSPPVMAVADARILAAMCSVTILVLRANHCTRKAAIHSRNALQSVGAHILGVVVNDVPQQGEAYAEYGAAYGAQPTPRPAPPASYPPADPNGRSAIIPAQSFLDLRRK